jgi:hypothetical protein
VNGVIGDLGLNANLDLKLEPKHVNVKIPLLPLLLMMEIIHLLLLLMIIPLLIIPFMEKMKEKMKEKMYVELTDIMGKMNVKMVRKRSILKLVVNGVIGLNMGNVRKIVMVV